MRSSAQDERPDREVIEAWLCTGARDWHGSRFDASSGTAVSPAGVGCARLRGVSVRLWHAQGGPTPLATPLLLPPAQVAGHLPLDCQRGRGVTLIACPPQADALCTNHWLSTHSMTF